MGTEVILKVLSDCGLTETESKVYLFLAKSGVQKVRDVSVNMKMHKAQVYRILTDLEARGMVEKTFESPMRFTALPFEELLNLCIEIKRNEANALENEKDRLVTVWKAFEIEKPPIEKFVIIEGRNNIYSRIRYMLDRASKEFFVLTTELGVIRGDFAGLLDAGLTRARKDKDIWGKILTPITKQNFEIIKIFTEKVTKGSLNIQWHYVNLEVRIFPRFVIKDEEEALFFVTSKEDTSITRREDTGLWTNSQALVLALKTFFEELWRDSKDVELAGY